MAYQCDNTSNQYFTIAATNFTVPPVTFSLWFNVSSIVSKDTALFLWRGTINTERAAETDSSKWELRYSIAGGTSAPTATGL